MKEISLYQRIYQVVGRVPRGRVTTYGQVARLVPGSTPRLVGYAMAALPEGAGVPWQRVINYQGRVSPRRHSEGGERQARLLRKEGIRLDRQGRVDLGLYGWGLSPIRRRAKELGSAPRRSRKKT